MRKILTSYSTVTPESAEDGDTADSGWIDEEGYEIEPDENDLDEEVPDDEHDCMFLAVVRLAVKFLRYSANGIEASCSGPWQPNIWYSDADSRQNYQTGAHTTHSFHLEGFSDREQAAIHAELTTRQYGYRGIPSLDGE